MILIAGVVNRAGTGIGIVKESRLQIRMEFTAYHRYRTCFRQPCARRWHRCAILAPGKRVDTSEIDRSGGYGRYFAEMSSVHNGYKDTASGQVFQGAIKMFMKKPG